MKNKGFTLVEILAVIVILGILTTMAAISVTRYRKDADQKDLLNLHSSIETSFANYRGVLAMSGEVAGSTLIISNNTTSSFDRYFQDLSYNGKRLSKSDLDGTVITLRTKGEVLSNSEYKTKGEEQFIKDATCIVESTVSNPGEENAKIIKKCKTTSTGEIEPSKDELICLKVSYNGTVVIDDYGKTDNALSFNKLCQYVSE